MSDAQLRRLVRTIVAADDAVVFAPLATKPGLVKAHFEDGATRQIAKPYHIDEIGHYVYSGDTALEKRSMGIVRSCQSHRRIGRR